MVIVMEIKIVSDKMNPLLHRREVRFIVEYEGTTPSIMDVKSKIVAMLNADKNLTVVDTLNQEYGKMECTGYVKIYDSEKTMNLIEKKSVLEKNKEKEEVVEEGE